MGFEIEKNLPSLGLKVFDIMRLVKYHIVPLLSPKDGMVSDCYFVACDTNVEAIKFGPSFPFDFAFFC